MTCPFYGHHDDGLGPPKPSNGNQCALVRSRFSPCTMQMRGLRIEWWTCLLRRGALPAVQQNRACIVSCSGCGLSAHACADPYRCDAVATGLCLTCLRRAEQLAEAAGQQRVLP